MPDDKPEFKNTKHRRKQLVANVRAHRQRKAMERNMVDPAHFEGKPHSTFMEDVQWAYSKILVRGVKAEDAPSSGAYWMLLQARMDPKVLREPLMLLARKIDQGGEEGEFKRDLERSENELMEMLARVEAVQV